MGGTSTDVCLIDGRPRTTHETSLAGLPVAVPVLDVHSVGAGGGSIARLDAGGALRVGPESAGADPGPACYDRGGTEVTVSDANLLLGRLDSDYFLGGTFHLSANRAEKACRDFFRRNPRSQLARSGLLTPLDLARGVIQVSNATMEKALRIISVERGYDPRDFTLVCFGGAGGVQAAELSTLLRIRQVLVPPNPGAFSALGILISDVVKDVSQSLLQVVPQGMTANQKAVFFTALEKEYRALETRGRHDLRGEGFDQSLARPEYGVDLRYVGQSYELTVPYSREFVAAFHRAHERAYGHAHPDRPLEVVTLRVRLIVPTPKPAVREVRVRASRHKPKPLRAKQVWFNGSFRETRLYDRSNLAPGDRFSGPGVILEYSSTTVVPPGFECRVDALQNLVLRPVTRQDKR
jgi:N-methylhydantoinase A